MIYDMASPGVAHQIAVSKLLIHISNYIDSKGGRCIVIQDLDTKLDTVKDTIVRPDISVICDRDKLTDKRCEGSPDWIIEVASPGNLRNDYLRKLELYNRTGIREYWIVDPAKENVIVYRLAGDSFDMTPYTFRDKVKVGIYDDLVIDFEVISEAIAKH